MLARGMRTSRFWWITLGYFYGLFACALSRFTGPEHLAESGFNSLMAAGASEIVGAATIPGRVSFRALFDA